MLKTVSLKNNTDFKRVYNSGKSQGNKYLVMYVVENGLGMIRKLCDVLGIITEVKKEKLDSEIEALIEERQAARKAKNFARADEIRDQLAAEGIILEDTREGVKWKRA